MRVVHISTSDRGSGAASAAYRLHRGLRNLGCDSMMFVAELSGDDHDGTVRRFAAPRDLPTRLRRRLRRFQIARSAARYSRSSHAEAFSDDRSPHGPELVEQLPPSDMINVHAMLNFVDYRDFFAFAPRRAPVVRTLHDMSFFTGGCHYDAGCGKYAARCGACPQLGSSMEHDLSREIWQRKQSAFKRIPPDRLFLVTPTRWLANEVRRSALLRDLPVTVVPLGLDTEIFRPVDRSFARNILGLREDAAVVLFVAEPITRSNKGFADLAQALDGLDRPSNLILLSAGSGRPPARVQKAHQHLGKIGDERLLSIVYNAADVFVIPSMQDNSPQTALEAIACGIPVVGYATCGIPEIVRPGLTGLLVGPKDIPALRTAIGDLLQNHDQRARLAADCRRIAVEEYALSVSAQRYVQLYQMILEGRRPPEWLGPPDPRPAQGARATSGLSR
jgi:glycosyltransferase involved in cell wall biosynthesis